MNKKILLAICIYTFILLTINGNGQYVSGRETVEASSISFTGRFLNETTDIKEQSDNITFFAGISIRNISFVFEITNSVEEDIYVNLTVNGILLIDNQIINNDTISVDESDYETAGGNLNLKYLNYVFNASDNVDFSLDIIAEVENFTPTQDIIIREKILSNPSIKFENSRFAVEDRITVTNNGDLELTNINITLTYPSHASNKDDEYIEIDELSPNHSINNYVSYQKKGPYIYSIGEAEKNSYGIYELSMKVRSYENESDATWNISYRSNEWINYLPELNLKELKIKINDKYYSFTYDATKITITGIDLIDGLNDVTFSWTPEVIQQQIPKEDVTRFISMIIVLIIVAIPFIWFMLKKS